MAAKSFLSNRTFFLNSVLYLVSIRLRIVATVPCMPSIVSEIRLHFLQSFSIGM